MSASVGAATAELFPGERDWRTRTFFIGITAVALVTLTLGLERDWHAILPDAGVLLVWVAVSALTDLLQLPYWGQATLAMSLPVTLAAGMVFPAAVAGLVGVVGFLDPREFRGEVGVFRAIFNRAQVGLSVFAASIVFHRLAPKEFDWPLVILAGLAAMVTGYALNATLVAKAIGMMNGVSLHVALKRVHDDGWREHVKSWTCLALVAVSIAGLYEFGGVWGFLCGVAPLTLAHQVFARGKQLESSARQIHEKNQAVLASIERVADERRDERLAVAGEIHDEILPPLFKVHLMGQVLRHDLNSGRLLDLDDDLPELLTATATAQDSIRGLVRDLRRSSLGPGGLNSTLELLARQLESAGAPPIVLDLDDVGGSSFTQLLTYQVAREALSNAARHSRAEWIRAELRRSEDRIRLVVEDNGVGFDRQQVDQDLHFGLQLIAERVEAAQGSVIIDSQLGRGTCLTAVIPIEVA